MTKRPMTVRPPCLFGFHDWSKWEPYDQPLAWGWRGKPEGVPDGVIRIDKRERRRCDSCGTTRDRRLTR